MASIIKSDNGVSSGITGIVQSADSSGQLALQTTTSSGTATTAVTIDNTQNLLVGTTSAIPGIPTRIVGLFDEQAAVGMTLKSSNATTGGYYQYFLNSSGSLAGSIQHTGSTTVAFNTSSDERLKKDKGVATDTSVIDNTIIHDFEWKVDNKIDRGVFAQEAYEIKPSAVSVGSDELTEDGNLAKPWSVDYSKYVPDLIVYCQQLKKQAQELSAQVTSLQATVETQATTIATLQNKIGA